MYDRPDKEHQHHWKERYTKMDGISCFVGLECECGLILAPDALCDLANRQSIVVAHYVLPKPGPSETK